MSDRGTVHGSDHLGPDLLDAFVRGDVGERTAIRIAEHLDVCPRCANLAREADPLARVFASVDDPVVPEDLVLAILAGEPSEPAVLPWAELGLAAGLLGAAGVAAWAGVEPASWWIDARAIAGALAAGLAHAAEHGRMLPVLAATAALAAAGSVVVGRRTA